MYFVSYPLDFSCGPAIPTVPPTATDSPTVVDYSTRESKYVEAMILHRPTTGKNMKIPY